MSGPGRCPRCGHQAHAEECRRLGPLTCQPLPESGSMRGRFPCGCTYAAGQPSSPVCTCGQELAWAVTGAGKPMPVERGSANAPDGTLAVWRDDRHRLRCRVLRSGEPVRAGEWRGRTHWGRCPDEARYRRGGRS